MRADLGGGELRTELGARERMAVVAMWSCMWVLADLLGGEGGWSGGSFEGVV